MSSTSTIPLLLPPQEITSSSISSIMDESTNDKSSRFVLPARNCCMPQFPMKLYGMVDEAERSGYQQVVSWLPGGKSFKIHDLDGLVPLLQLHFNQTKYKSFLRQLQNYGFKRIFRGKNKGICTHEFFQKGRMSLCSKMQRISRSTSSPSLLRTNKNIEEALSSSLSAPTLLMALPQSMINNKPRTMPTTIVSTSSTGVAEIKNSVFDLTRMTRPAQPSSSCSSMFSRDLPSTLGRSWAADLTDCTDQAPLQSIEKEELVHKNQCLNKKEEDEKELLVHTTTSNHCLNKKEEVEKQELSCFLEDFEPSALMMDPDGVTPSWQAIFSSFQAASSVVCRIEDGDHHPDEEYMIFGGNTFFFEI